MTVISFIIFSVSLHSLKMHHYGNVDFPSKEVNSKTIWMLVHQLLLNANVFVFKILL